MCLKILKIGTKNNNNDIEFKDGYMLSELSSNQFFGPTNLLKTIFKNGQVYNVQTLAQIRAKLRSQ